MYFANRNHFHPFAGFNHLDQWMQEVEQAFHGRTRNSSVQPNGIPINLWTSDQKTVVSAEVPGVDPNNISINVQDDVVTIGYEQKNAEAEEHTNIRRASRTIQLPFSIDSDATEAHCQYGLLTITLTPSKKDIPKKIAIKAS